MITASLPCFSSYKRDLKDCEADTKMAEPSSLPATAVAPPASAEAHAPSVDELATPLAILRTPRSLEDELILNQVDNFDTPILTLRIPARSEEDRLVFERSASPALTEGAEEADELEYMPGSDLGERCKNSTLQRLLTRRS